MEDNAEHQILGIAKALLSRIVNEAREYRCGSIQITASIWECICIVILV